MLIDEITLDLGAGRGGDGVVRWLHEKFKEFSGPSGGDGGKGGDVYVEAVQDVWLLVDYRNIKKIRAKNGFIGGSRGWTGKNAPDLVVKLPVGSHITNLSSGREYDLTKVGERQILLFGGLGGKGNRHFKSFTEQKPEKQTDGRPGEKAKFKIELRLIADFGLMGLPNAGKSSLLNALTGARAKIGDYRFTTLDPNLGNLYGFVMADIPGLIEGASEGRGLGHKFLKHIQRTGILIHCLSLESENLEEDYSVIRKELGNFNKELLKKSEIVVLTKKDILLSEKDLISKKALFEKKGLKTFVVSILEDESIKSLSDNLVKIISQKI